MYQHLKVRSGAKTRPKARGHKQGTEAKPRPLRLNTTEGAFKKEAQFCLTANGRQLRDEHTAKCSAVLDCERGQTAAPPRAT